jgi:hypothetical protein
LDETLWQLAKRLPDYAPRKKRRKELKPIQLPLLEDVSDAHDQAIHGEGAPPVSRGGSINDQRELLS